MGWKREDLSDDERKEYDDLLTEAGLDDNGQAREAGEIAERMHRLLLAADQAGRRWAQWILADDAEEGHRRRWNAWWKKQRSVSVYDETLDAFIPRPAAQGVRRKRDDGSTYYQQSIWDTLTFSEVEQKVEEALAARRAARINLTAARRILALRDEVPDAATVGEAVTALGMTVDEWLTQGAA